ncbi:hypothetical protein FMN50_02260 [Rhodobacterales bacterium]|nr:hypothetical protein FMN50_02260 [Rhodobacterales bacterium]
MQTLQRDIAPANRVAPLKGGAGSAPAASLKIGRLGRPSAPFAIVIKFLSPGVLSGLLWTHVWLGLSTAALLCLGGAIGLAALQRLPFRGFGARSWMGRVGFGERVFLNRLVVPIPADRGRRITVLYLVFGVGAAVALVGGALASLVLTCSGLVVAMAAQVTCFRHLANLHRSMESRAPLYRFWTVSALNDN